MTKEESIDAVYSIKMLFERIYNLPFPTLSAIKGACLGGGLELAMSCDFRFGQKKSLYGLPETSLGIIPGAGGQFPYYAYADTTHLFFPFYGCS